MWNSRGFLSPFRQDLSGSSYWNSFLSPPPPPPHTQGPAAVGPGFVVQSQALKGESMTRPERRAVTPKWTEGTVPSGGAGEFPPHRRWLRGVMLNPPIFVCQVAEGQRGERCPPDPRSTALRLHRVDGAQPEPHPSPSSWRMRVEDWPPERSGDSGRQRGSGPKGSQLGCGLQGVSSPRPGLSPGEAPQPTCPLPPALVLAQLLWPQAASSKDVPPCPPIPQPRRVSARNKP